MAGDVQPNIVTRFLREYFLKPGTIGAVVPSSKALAAEMVDWLELDAATAVLEYGPGTGPFTETLLPRLAPQCRFVMIELNPVFVELLREKFPGRTIVQDSVAHARKICDQHGIGYADCILSGLPWASFPEALQRDCLDAMMNVLRPGGQFVTFAYLPALVTPAARRFRKMLRVYFSSVSPSRTIWNNLPPAFVYRCRKRSG